MALLHAPYGGAGLVLGNRKLPGTNTLAYFSPEYVRNDKKITTLTGRVFTMQILGLLVTPYCNKLVRLSHLHYLLICVGKPRSRGLHSGRLQKPNSQNFICFGSQKRPNKLKCLP